MRKHLAGTGKYNFKYVCKKKIVNFTKKNAYFHDLQAIFPIENKKDGAITLKQ